MLEWLRKTASLTLPHWAFAALFLALALALAALWLVRRRRTVRGKAAEAPAGVRVGKVHEQGAREGQQDCFAVSDEALFPTRGLLAVVADGMGGLADGEKVSATAVQSILDTFLACRGGEDPEQLLLVLAQGAVQAVNRQLGPEGFRESGSTLVMGLVRSGSLFFLSVGDSRICLLRRGVLTQLNREHIYRRELALRMVNGQLKLPEVYASSRGAGLTSFLGMGELTAVDMPAAPLHLLPGDRVVLMSDGVYNALEEELLRALAAETPEAAAEAVREAVREKDYQNQDNYTAVILEWNGEEGEGS